MRGWTWSFARLVLTRHPIGYGSAASLNRWREHGVRRRWRSLTLRVCYAGTPCLGHDDGLWSAQGYGHLRIPW